MLDRILIATDGSRKASAAIDHGLELAETFDAEVHVVYVVETKASYILSIGASEEGLEEYRQYGQEVVDEVVDRADRRGLEAVGAVESGTVAQQLLEYTDREDVDAVVMGERGRGTLERYLGSNVEKVVRLCSKPVTVVRS
ncbi:universal stress protein [Natronococcus occultus]|uniref:Universal stress protein UspA-like protein n=1 Tax=Natronococcus occultus SP4 TaxID=694430 RepID=L0JW35_9EURY|nr:universal stress protein [Natronococcus occultus]AGB37237.1 universal stress protein UspA-like protein [Natronococcus occultus SP4]